jgi:phenylacetate-CoA ligase
MGIDLRKEANIRLTFHTGEPGGAIPSVKHKIEEAFGCKTYDIAGLTEIAAWGFECEPQPGGDHIHDDYVLSEVLDIETGKPVGPGEQGELVLTNLYRHAMPLLRYRTKDIVKIAATPCPCGRTLRRFDGGVIGRLDDMKKVRGVVVYPSKIQECVQGFPEVAEYEVLFHRKEGLDEITVKVECVPNCDPAIVNKIADDLRLAIGIRAGVEMLPPDSLPRWDHKARRVKDDRTEVPF